MGSPPLAPGPLARVRGRSAQRQRGVVEQRHQDQVPAPAKDTDQPQAGGTPRPRRLGHQRRDVGTVLAGIVSSASPPTLSSHKVATATASHRRAARAGWVMWVRCHCQPARLVILKPCSIQARNPYQQAVLASGGRSVRINQGSLYPPSQHASSVQWSWRWRPLKAIPVPCHVVPGRAPTSSGGPRVPGPWDGRCLPC